MKRLFTILIISLLYQLVQAADPVLNYGLRFQSSSVPFEKTTSLFLNQGNAYHVQKKFTLQFNLEIHKEHDIYPYGNIFCLNYDGRSFLSFRLLQDRIFSIIYAGKIYSFDTDIELETWKPLSVSFDFDKGYVYLSCGDKKSQVKVPFKKHPEIVVLFGDDTPENNTQKDVPTMILKDVKVYTDGNLVNYWKLDRYDRNVSYDELSLTKASVKNPIWEIDSHTKWKKVYSKDFKAKEFIDVVFDRSQSLFSILTSDSLNYFNGLTDSVYSHPANNTSLSQLSKRGHFDYDPFNKSIFFYALDDRSVSYYSPKKNIWNLLPSALNKNGHQFHASVYNEQDTSIYFFGGYGFYKFRNELMKLNLQTGTISKVEYSPSLSPRYSAAMTIIEDELYVFGGRGNNQGRQEFHVDNYGELHSINLKTKQSQRIWKIQSENNISGLCMAPQMYYEPYDSTFTAASIYKDSVYLWRISRYDSIIKLMVKPMAVQQIALPTISTRGIKLFLSAKRDKYFLFVHENLTSGQDRVSIYSINAPVLDKTAILANYEAPVTQPVVTKSAYLRLVFAFIIVLFLVLCGFYFYKEKKKEKERISSDENTMELPDTDYSPINNTEENLVVDEQSLELPEVNYFDRKHSSISLLGGFNVFDKEGVDITSLFTPRLKSLLLLIILHTEKNPKGIFVNFITESLWPEKEVESARNNLNVSLRKLRLLLDKVGDLKISNNSGFISIHWSNDVFCDYREALYSIRLSNNVPSDNDLFNKILELMLYGPLLPNTVFDWLDNFKEAYSSMAIDFLRESLDLQKGHNAILLKITHIMFLHDTLSEDALRVQCTVLINQGKKGLAMKAYNHFCKEYKDLLGIDYKKSIQDLYME